KTLAAPIGVMAGGQIFSLDIHEAYHGCHGLVAGTTGSGKSEFLQAFVLSLAINYSPKEIAFVLVDFKGGDMARPFMAKHNAPAMPHLAATISNLSGNILYRAIVSLEAEIKSRQRVFNAAATELGVDKLDINSYHKYYKAGRLAEPLPHLVIIIDEFAQLKTQQPEFLAQLINVAQVGRSLGIHLILATQKPNGIVDPQIMSNSRFKVCLKVAEKQDSMDMINRPDSAMIKNPGRLNLLVGYNEIYETIQSGFSGADYVPLSKFIPDDEITVQLTDNAANPIHSARLNLASEKSGKTQLEAVVADIVKLGQKKHLKVKPLWLDMLAERITFKELALGEKGYATVTVGMVDYVRTQEQKPLTFDLCATGHVGLYGASGMGKTTFLQTMVYSMVKGYGYTPEELNIYAMDFGGRNLGYLKELPHTGGVVFADESQKVSSLISLLQETIEERKQLLANSNCGTFSEYRGIGNKLPAVLVLIDNYTSFRDKYMDESERLVEIIASGKTYGIFFVITSSTRNGIHYKVVEYISAFYA
ncbi:MAG: FtsK/SpoIIIE domain-containing protein, partial [Phascolarctobacterium sp.]